MNENVHLEVNILDILEQFDVLEEASLSNLKNSTTREFGTGRSQRSNKVNITGVTFVPSIQEKSLLIKAKTQTIGKNDTYDTHVKFVNVKYVDQPEAGTVSIKAADGQTYNIKRLTHAQATAKVRCTCLDFYFMFSAWNQQKNALDGAPMPPYIKKTDRPPINPNRIAGSCKHVTKLGDYLRFKQIIS
jgi:hypothetical protein